MPQGSLADRVTRWRTLSDALAADLEEFPHLKDTHAEFHAAVSTIEALMVEEDQHTAALSVANTRRRELETRCIDLAGRIVTGIQSVKGKRNPELLGFGIDPLRAGRRRREEEPDTEPEAPSSGS
jgi:hypothetical protein